MDSPRILIAGIGNIFLGDDAFGVEVAQQMLREPAMTGVCIVDFGIRGLDLTYALLEDYDAAILVDAVPRGETPGTLYLIEPDPSDIASTVAETPQPGEVLIDAHSMDPVKALRLSHSMGGTVRRILLVGCEPTPFDPETDMEMSLTAPVRAAVPAAIAMIRSCVVKLQNTPAIELKGAGHHGSPVTTV